MDKKLQKLNTLVTSAKNKIETIQSQHKSLHKLNTKLEVFLTTIDALRIPTIQETNNLSPDFFNNSFSQSIHLTNHSTLVSEKYTLETIKIKIREINLNSKFMLNAEKIVDCINETKDGLGLDDIMRKSGVSKYRCVEIVNELMKCVPQILVKKGEGKNFKYELNMIK